MKRITTRFLTAVLVGICLTGCPSTPPANPPVDPPPDTPTDDPNTPPTTNDQNTPVATACGSVAFACYDEHPSQSVGLIGFRPNSRWPRTDLTWQLTNPLATLETQPQIDAVDRAFKVWASRSTLRFTQVDVDPDITISFENDAPGELNPFDGAGGFLGRAFFPGTAQAGTIQLCADEAWGAGGQGGKIDLFTVALHEIGHALGLEHIRAFDAVMRPGYNGPVDGLKMADIEAIQRLYGSRDGTVQPAGLAQPGTAPNLDDLGEPDADNDGLPDVAERFWFGTDPSKADTDDDGIDDFTEIFITGTPPLVGGGADADSDGVPDDEETNVFSTDPNNADTDGDQLDDGVELFFFGTNPNDPDTDQDGLNDGTEIDVTGTDPLDPDTDFDGLLDGQDPNPLGPQDRDMDGLPDGIEIFFFNTDPANPDTDGDGFSDFEEVDGVPATNPNDPADNPNTPIDSDGDSCTDFEEIAYGACDADPFSPTQMFTDADNDGLSDDDELLLGTDLFNPDTDGDGFFDGEEALGNPGTNPLDPTDNPNTPIDSDNDGCTDFDEINFGFCDGNPFTTFVDSDGDGLADGEEEFFGTNPFNPDTDGDGFNDFEELHGVFGSATDPLNPNDNPNTPIDSDGDGCTDFDEINFGACNGDPFVP